MEEVFLVDLMGCIAHRGGQMVCQDVYRFDDVLRGRGEIQAIREDWLGGFCKAGAQFLPIHREPRDWCKDDGVA